MYRKILQPAYRQPAGTASDQAVPSFAGRPRNRTWQFARGDASRWLAAVLFAAAMLAGRTVGPDYKRPAIAVPADWRNGWEERESIANPGWWLEMTDRRRDDSYQVADRRYLDDDGSSKE